MILNKATQGRSVGIYSFAAILLLAMLLLRFPPEQYTFYPRCPINQYTGWLCPGCGMTRALAALLRGHVRDAWALNGLAVVLLPGLLLYAGSGYVRGLRGNTPRWPALPRAVVMTLLAVAAGFTIVRNLL